MNIVPLLEIAQEGYPFRFLSFHRILPQKLIWFTNPFIKQKLPKRLFT